MQCVQVEYQTLADNDTYLCDINIFSVKIGLINHIQDILEKRYGEILIWKIIKFY